MKESAHENHYSPGVLGCSRHGFRPCFLYRLVRTIKAGRSLDLTLSSRTRPEYDVGGFDARGSGNKPGPDEPAATGRETSPGDILAGRQSPESQDEGSVASQSPICCARFDSRCASLRWKHLHH